MSGPLIRSVAVCAAAAVGVFPPASGVRAAFERPPAGPETAALGEVIAVSADPVFGNPAPVGKLRSLQAAVWGSRPFGLPELIEGQAAASLRRGAVSAGVGFRRFGTEAYAEKEVRCTGGWEVTAALGVGVAVRGLAVEGTGFAPRRSLAVDGGFRFRPDPGSEIGAVLEAVLGEVPGDPAGRRRRSALGASRRLGRLTVSLEVQRREDRPLAGVVGLEWSPVPPVVVRAGTREDPASVAWGFTVRHGGLALAASATHTALGRTLRVGVATRRGQP